MPAIDGVVYPDTAKEIRKNEKLYLVFKRVWTAQATSNDRAFFERQSF